MNWRVQLGMTLEQVQAAAPGPVEVKRFGDVAHASFDADGWGYNAHLDGRPVDHVWATRRVSTLHETLEILEELVTEHGPPSFVRDDPTAESYEWEWNAQPTTVVVSREDAGTWFVRADLQHTAMGPPAIAPIELAAARELVATVGQQLRHAAESDGPRGKALVRWRDFLDARRARLEQFLDMVAIVTSHAPILSFDIAHLHEQAGWLARHDALFTDPYDWCDAIVEDTYLLGRNHLGWRIHQAEELGHPVSLVEGPFVTGILRMQHVDPSPILENDGSAEVKVTVQGGRALASYRGIVVNLSGQSAELGRIARLLAVARSRS